MFEIGRLCVKLAGRDSNKKCVIIDILDEKTVVIAGQTRRRKCNVKHLEPLEKVLKIAKNAKFTEISKAFNELGIELKETNQKPKTEKPKKTRKKKETPSKEPKKQKKTEKKQEAKPQDKPAAKQEAKPEAAKAEKPKEAAEKKTAKKQEEVKPKLSNK